MKKIGFIGAGNMAFAIGNPLDNPVFLFDKFLPAMERFENKDKTICENLSQLVDNAEIIFLSVKPQNFPEVLEELAKIPHENKLFCSIAAGISLSYLEQMLGSETHLLRAMPNTPLLVGKGAVALCKNSAATDSELKEVAEIFGKNGKVCFLEETQMNPEIAIHGSSPAIFFEMAALVKEYAKNIGLSEEDGVNLFASTMAGAAEMLLSSGKTPEELSKMVCSPGGTTLAMLDVLKEQKAGEALLASFDACTKRAEELSK